ncbi:MAG TPA: efflux RND transporter periplasmic adaptor subunit [Candidatus Sulfotelmatobacter sp.]|nr:efflux RND transporter periplasmic adaptor subunit [Candidatus Sulfotelmatobacter sp.]
MILRYSLLAITALAVSISFGCSSTPASQSEKPAISGSAQEVNVVAVESQKLNTVLSLPAQTTPYEAVAIFPKVTGFIEKISVDRGSHVKSGDLIVQLSAPELLAQRSQGEANLQTAQAHLAAAQAKLLSDNGTYEHLTSAAKTPGVVSGNDLLVAEQTTAADRAQVEAAQHGVLAAQDALRSVTQLESYLQIRAPFDGVITERNLHPGALVGPSSGQSGAQPIVRIEDVGRLRLIVPVPEQYVPGVREGTSVAFTIPAYPGQTFRAPIARISHDIDQNTRTMAVELDVRNLQITPGTFANVQWPVERGYPTLFVPTAAITTNLQRTFVIRVRDGKAEWIDVKSGASAAGKTEVFGDLKDGDQVVVPASDELAPGTTVVAHAANSSR